MPFVTFTGPVPQRAVHELRAVPGVLLAEGQRDRCRLGLIAGHRTYRTAIIGLARPTSELKVLRDSRSWPHSHVPARRHHAQRAAGRSASDCDRRSGSRSRCWKASARSAKLTVVKLSEDILGLSATMDIRALNRLLRRGDVINAAALKVDRPRSLRVWRQIAAFPKIEASSVKSLWLGLFDGHIAGMIFIGAVILVELRHPDRGRRRLQQRARCVPGARLGAGEPPHPRLHPRRGDDPAAHRAGIRAASWRSRSDLLIGRGLIRLIVAAARRASCSRCPRSSSPGAMPSRRLWSLPPAAASALARAPSGSTGLTSSAF